MLGPHLRGWLGPFHRVPVTVGNRRSCYHFALQAGLGQTGLKQRAVQSEQQSGELARGPAGRLPGRRVALLKYRADQLLDEREVTVGGSRHGPQVPGLNAVTGEASHGERHIERVLPIDAGLSA